MNCMLHEVRIGVVNVCHSLFEIMGLSIIHPNTPLVSDLVGNPEDSFSQIFVGVATKSTGGSIFIYKACISPHDLDFSNFELQNQKMRLETEQN